MPFHINSSGNYDVVETITCNSEPWFRLRDRDQDFVKKADTEIGSSETWKSVDFVKNILEFERERSSV